MERICIDTLHYWLPLNARAARKSDGRKTVSVPHPASPVGEVAERSEDGEGQIGNVNRKMLKALSVTCGDSSQGIIYWHRNGAYLYRYAPF